MNISCGQYAAFPDMRISLLIWSSDCLRAVSLAARMRDMLAQVTAVCDGLASFIWGFYYMFTNCKFRTTLAVC